MQTIPLERLSVPRRLDIGLVRFKSDRADVRVNVTQTIQARLDAVDHRPAGFDYMRISLAAAVLAFHSIGVSYGYAVQEKVMTGPWRSLWVLILPLFFSLSGFLVAGSLERSKTLVTFFGLRALRIVPALSGEVLLSALILGPIFTSVTLSAYFGDPLFYKYFLNILGEPQFRLPGVFLNNPHAGVINNQLWTIPYELICYAVLGVLAVIGAFKHRWWFLIAIIAVYPYLAYLAMTSPRDMTHAVSGKLLVLCFLWGVALYRFRDKVVWSFWLFALAAATAFALNLYPNGDRFSHLPMAYCTVYLGLLNPKRLKILFAGDFSYGLYLYGGPVQQAVAAFGSPVHEWWINLLISVPITSALAIASWYLIEKPTLAWRSHLKRLETWYIPRRAAWIGRFKTGNTAALDSPRDP